MPWARDMITSHLPFNECVCFNSKKIKLLVDFIVNLEIFRQMFFLGGFNTIFPHLIYLSLIWAFLLIGLSGKLNLSWADKIFHTEQQTLNESAVDEQHDFVSTYIIVDANSDNAEKDFSESVLYLTLHNPVKPFVGWPLNIVLRGPPLA